MGSRAILSERLSVRLPAEEAADWKAAAARSGLTLSDWLRSQIRIDGVDVVVTRKPPPRKVAARAPVHVDPALVRAVANAGNNLNQIARHLHSGGAIDSTAILAALVATEQRLQEILNGCTSSF